MTDRKKRTGSLLYRLILIALACVGVGLTLFGSKGEFMGGSSLCFYTIQSNLWALVLTLAAVILSLLKRGEPRWFRHIRFVIAVAIMVTLLVFWTMLMPSMPPQYLISVSNLTLHTLVPLMLLLDALFIDKGFVPTKKQVLLCSLPPLYYFCFSMLRAELSDALFSNGSRYPYWFIDVDKFGWFGFEKGVGVFYWVLVVVALVLGLGYLLRWLKQKTAKQKTKG